MENKIPRISVLMPVYNAQAYLTQAIESILNQTYKNFEFIIIDDGSDDKSLEIIRTFAQKDNSICIIENKTNIGQAASLNKGIKAARGEFIAIMDADDISLPDRFDKQIKYLNQHNDIDMCGTGYRELIDNHIGDVITLPESHSEIICSLLFYCPFTHPTVMFRREVFIKNELFYDPMYITAVDYELWSRAQIKVRFANVNDGLLLYRIHKYQMSQNLSEKQRNECKYVLARLLDQLGVVYSQEELNFHSLVYWRQIENSMKFLNNIKEWFNKLQLANDHSRLFPEPIFSRLISDLLSEFSGKGLKSESNQVSEIEYAYNRVTPKVSVVIPFLNAKKFLNETIESVLAQTFKDWELLLVDDGSTDGSTEIAKDYSKRYFSKVGYLCHEGHLNQGLPASRNLGLHHAKGVYIIPLDSDDIWLPEKLEKHVSTLELHPEADALFGETLYWYSWTQNPEDKLKDYIWAPWKPHGIQFDTNVQPPKLLRLLLEQNVMPIPCSLLMRRTIVDHIGGWVDEMNNLYEDQAFFVKLFMKSSVLIVDGCQEKYRLHVDSICSVFAKEGKTLPSRIFFLNWVKKYLSDQNYHDPQIEQYLNNELKPYLNPFKNNEVEIPLPVGLKNFGDLHRLSPVSRIWGFDRGPLYQRAQVVDRYYIETFLLRHSADIQGRVLEIGDSGYTRAFGGDRVTYAEVLDADPDNKGANYVFDLAVGGDGFPLGIMDCFILTQALQFMYDVQAAVRNVYAALKPGGILLATLPGISQICRPEMEKWGDYWRFTDASVRRLFGDVFGSENIAVETHGNVLAASAFLFNLAADELQKDELDFNDPDYQVIITVRAVKQEGAYTHPSNMVEKLTAQEAEKDQALQALSAQISDKEQRFQLQTARLAECEQKKLESEHELAEIKSSKAWKIALLLRRVRVMLIPPGSSCELMMKKAYKFLSSPRRQFSKYFFLKKNIALVNTSGFFDETLYLANNPDVAKTKMDPCKHYLLYGGFEGRDPGQNFRSGWYLDVNPDVKKAGINPLLHYLKYGKNEGRSIKNNRGAVD